MVTTVEATEFTDLGNPIMYTNPYPRYAYLREHAPVSRVKAPLLVRGTGYMLTRFADVETIHSDPRFSTNAIKNSDKGKHLWLMPPTLQLLTETMVLKDDPDHKRLRNLVHKAFTPKFVATMASDITRITGDLIEQLAAKRDIDLVEDFAVRLPLTVIASMLGVCDADRDQFHAWGRRMSRAARGGTLGLFRTAATSRRLLRMFKRLADDRRRNPDDGLISKLVAANEDGDNLTDREVVAMIYLLLIAGHDTTANLIGSSVLALVQNPDQLAAVRANPGLLKDGIEELLRYTSPVPCGTTRIALEDVEIAGTTIPKGSQILGMIISANRDERVYENPEALDLTRELNRHLAFAFGTHYCLGHELARMEGRIALTALLERFEHWEITVPVSRLSYKPTVPLRGLTSLPMRMS
jgi:cytochrome P450